jgi:uncharacterized protein (TIGR02246 family)
MIGGMRLAVALVSVAAALPAADMASEVEKTERAFVQAVVKADAAALERYLSPDLMYTHSSGVRDTRESYISGLRSGAMKYEKWDIEKLEVRKVTDDVAVVALRSAMRVANKGKPVNEMTMSILHVFARRDGRWQLVAHQSARLPPQ